MASTANLTLSGIQTIDAIVGVAGNVVFAKDQTTQTARGLYVMAAGAWARLPEADNGAELVSGSLIVVQEGTVNKSRIYELDAAPPIVVGTTNLTFTRVDGASGAALSSTNPADVGTAAAVGIGTTAARADHVHDFNPTDTATVTWDFSTPGTIKANASTGGSAPPPASTVTDVVATASVVGVGVSFARNDHAHFHGELPGGDLHDLVNFAESGLPGFMSVADKSKLDGIEDNATLNEPSNVDPEEITDATPDPGAGADFSRFDHVHAHGERGAGTTADPLHTVATNEAPGFMAAADHAALALWDVTKCRYFFIDNEAGNDTHTGFLDRAPGHAFGGGETAAVDAAKIKTVGRLLEVLPRNGNGRMAKLLFKNRTAGTPYLQADAATEADLDLTGITGYRWIGRCGSSALSNDTNDMTQAGGIIAEDGPNGDNSYTVAGLASNTLTIGSGTYPSDDEGAGWRVRFKGNVTPEVENLCIPIYRIPSSTQMKLAYVPPVGPPDTGDEFFIERIGVTFRNVYDIASATSMNNADAAAAELVSPMVGIQAQPSADTDSGVFRMGCVGKTLYAFCAGRDAGETQQPHNLSNSDAGHLGLSDTFVDEIGQPWAVGPCRFDANVHLQAQTIEIATGGLFCSTNSVSRTVDIKAELLTVGSGTQFKQAVAIELRGAGPSRIGDSSTSVPVRLGTTTTVGAGILIRAGSASAIINGIIFDTVEGDGADYGVIVTGGPRAGVNVETIGSGPNVGFANFAWGAGATDMKGIKIADCYQGRFVVDDTTIDPSGITAFRVHAAGIGTDILTMSIPNFADNSLIDERGNEVLGSAGRVNSECHAYYNGEGGTVVYGSAVLASGAIGGYPSFELAIASQARNGISGITLDDFATDGKGFIATRGTPWSKDGGTWTPGDIIYLSADFAGGLDNVSPSVGVGRYKNRVGRAHFVDRVQLFPENAGVLADAQP